MICEKCKQEIADNLKFCNKCGAKIVKTVVPPPVETQNAPNQDGEKKQAANNKTVPDVTQIYANPAPQTITAENVRKTNVKIGCKSRATAGWLGILFGGLGLHNFYLGFHVRAIIQIVLSVFCGGIGFIWGFIEGILILAKKINVDAKGRPFK